jgi:hypothetical protein
MADKKTTPHPSRVRETTEPADTTAPPSHEADDYVGNLKYEDAPADMKPSPDSIVQVQVLPDPPKGDK